MSTSEISTLSLHDALPISTETVGSFVQDRHTGILGEFGKKAEMIPVTLTIHGGTGPKQFHYEVLNNARLSPVAISTTVRSEEHTSELQSLRHLVCRLLLEKYVNLRNLYSFPTRRSSDLNGNRWLVCAGPSHWHSWRIWQEGGNDSGNTDHPRWHGT